MRTTLSSTVRLASVLLAAATGAANASPGEAPEAPRLGVPEIGDGGGAVQDEPDALALAKEEALDLTRIRFRNGHAVPAEPGLAPDLALPLDGILVLQFPGPVRKEWWDAVAAAGVVVHDHVGVTAVVTTVPESASEEVVRLVAAGILRHVGPYPAAAKIAPEIAGQTGPAVPVQVHLAPGRTPDRDRARALLGVEQERDGTAPGLRGRIPAARLHELAEIGSVLWVEPDVTRRGHNLEAAMTGADQVAGLGVYTGFGVRVAVNDTGISRTGDAAQCGAPGAGYHPDLPVPRIADEWDFRNNDAVACDDNGHGTHTTGTIGGDGSADAAWTGIAPEVTLLAYKDANQFGTGHVHFNDVLVRAAAHDANVVANGWGGGNGLYNVDSYDADGAVRGAYFGSDTLAQPMFLTVSAGNENDRASAPGTAKNVVTVGAMKDGNWPDVGTQCWLTNQCNGLCDCLPAMRDCGDGYGPASERICFSNHGALDTDLDGFTRLKPDLVAPGTRIRSTAAAHLLPGGDLYEERDGTSMAQAVVAGTAALTMQAYPVLRDWPELLKARLLATAISLGDESQFGHGMLDSLHAVYDSSSLTTALWQGDLLATTGSSRDHFFSVPSGYREVRVYLVWADPPSLTTEVVNDMDLRVYDGQGVQVGFSLENDETVESVRIQSSGGIPVPGTWRARVTAFSLATTSQRYAVIAVVIRNNASLSLIANPPSTCLGPGEGLQITSTLSNPGISAAASQVTLDLPDDPSVVGLDDAVLFTDDPARAHVYEEAEIHHETPTNRYRLALGETNQNISRIVIWNLTVGGGAPAGFYDLTLEGEAFGLVAGSRSVTLQVEPIPAETTGLLLAGFGSDLQFFWQANATAASYVVQKDTDPRFLSPAQVGATSVQALTEPNGMLDPAPLVFYRVLGVNECGVSGP
jgi:hypothetical protein